MKTFKEELQSACNKLKGVTTVTVAATNQKVALDLRAAADVIKLRQAVGKLIGPGR